jgi:CubicO group peptidase (beta-lactamase class C family)
MDLADYFQRPHPDAAEDARHPVLGGRLQVGPRRAHPHLRRRQGRPAGEQRFPTAKPRFLAGSGGLFSTAPDYYRFCQALLTGRPSLEGARVLKPETVKLMRKSVLQPGVGIDLYGPVQKGLGFGMDFAIHERPAESGLPHGQTASGGAAPSAPGSGSTRPTTSSSWA